MVFLHLKDITKSYYPDTSRNRVILSGLNLEVDSGESIAIIGPSGSGKTTLLNIMGTLDQPDDGEVLYKGKDISRLDPKELASFRSKEIGFVFQEHYLLPQCTLWENVLLPTLPIKNLDWKKKSISKVEKLLKKTGIWDQRDQKPNQLSGGECQRAAVVRALVNGPGLLLADEPTGSLDQKNSDILADLLFEVNSADQVTLILVTHDRILAAKADRIYSLVEGKLVPENA
jgi:ABC-type lipoprotein export system ATPase subunit